MSPSRFVRSVLPAFALGILLQATHSGDAQAVCNGSQFGATFQLDAVSAPHGCVIGDFNEDGFSDLAVAVSMMTTTNGSGGHVRVFLGNGNGTFANPVQYPTGSGCFAVVAADFNQDGILDLATANTKTSNISILIGQGSGGVGNGTFAPVVNYFASAGPWDLATGDFDEDGFVDLAVSNNVQASVTVLRGLGDGTMAFSNVYPLPSIATDVNVADVNEDGIQDLLVVSGSVQLLKGQAYLPGIGSGTFDPPVAVATGAEPFMFDIADFDQDGILDLAVANSSTGGLKLHRGQGSGGVGNGTFGPAELIADGNIGAAVAVDLNQDGKLDVVSTRTSAFEDTPLLVSLGHGNGSFDPPQLYMIGRLPVGVAVGSIDGLPKPDVAVCNYLQNRVTVLLGQCGPQTPGAPMIDPVRDVPNDQGGKVFVTWTASSLDAPSGPVTGYRVWRRIPSALALRHQQAGTASIRTREAGPASSAVTYWEAAATLPAQRLPGYGYTAATPQDSLAGSNPYTAFFITATTSDIDVFYDSAIDSGYSVDNLAPSAPQNATAMLQGQQVVLVWQANAEPDIGVYRIHRGNTAGFVPTEANRVATVSGTQYVDTASPNLYYKLVAVDVHGNAGPSALAIVAGPTAVAVSAVDPVVGDGGVRLGWRLGEAVTVDVQRSSGAIWETRTTLTPDASGAIQWIDSDVVAGTTYDYRLRLPGDVFAGSVSIRVPAFTFGLDGVTPQPARSGSFGIRFRLADHAPALLEIVDVGGRRVLAERVDSFGPGEHVFSADRVNRVPAGVYLVRLTSGARTASKKAVVIQ